MCLKWCLFVTTKVPGDDLCVLIECLSRKKKEKSFKAMSEAKQNPGPRETGTAA